MKIRCQWCGDEDHWIATCPKAMGLSVNVQRRAEQRDSATAERMIAFRTFAGQLTRHLVEANIPIPAATLALDPDRPFPPYAP